MSLNYPDYCIITMAGLGSRFKKAGYSQPKYEINVLGKSLFNWSLLSLSQLFDKSHFIFITLKELSATGFIENNCKLLGINNFTIIELPKLTLGQAQSAASAVQIIGNEQSVLIFNIDTYIEPPYLSNIINYNSDGDVICFSAPGNHWSFVKTDENNNVIEVKEKERISDNCSVGAYYFKKFGDFLAAYAKGEKAKNELYIAPLYNTLIENHLKVSCSKITDSAKVHVLGTPEELELFKKFKE